MPLQTVVLQPGVNVELTQTLGQAQIVNTQLVRFKGAGDRVLVEKLGGWAKFYPLAFGSPAREMHAWEGINADTHLAVGCEGSLNVITAGLATDITPNTLVTDPAVDFSTTSTSETVTIVDAGIATSVYDTIFLETPVSVGGIVLKGVYAIQSVLSSTSYTIKAASAASGTVANGGAVPAFTTTSGEFAVNVDLADHGYSVGETFNIPTDTATTVGGITLSGAYIVQTVVDGDNFTINASQTATSTDTQSMNGGNAAIVYYIAKSPSVPSAPYGSGTYGSGAYGVGISPTPTPGTPITTSNWTLDNWGEILLSCPTNGPIFTWSPDSGFENAAIVPGAPVKNGGIFVAEPAQIAVAWASSIDGVQDPLLVQWSDAGDYTNWTASALTQAGNYRLPTGSKIMGGLVGPQFSILWTDLDVWSMDYIEPPLVFGFNKLATNCGLISRHAACVINAQVYWMGVKQFYAMNGGSVASIPCPVWDVVFQDIDMDNADKIHVAPNSGFGEVTWYYPSKSGGRGEVDSYVKVNTSLGYIWDFGKLQRTAWIDQSVLGQPIGADASGNVYQHEISTDADGQPMISYFDTGYFRLADGEDLLFVDWIIPDFKYGYFDGSPGAALQITMNFTDYPNRPASTKGPYNVTSATEFVTTRFRAREVAFRAGSSDLGSFWRMGGLGFRATADGKR
jgi:hypothetical protein